MSGYVRLNTALVLDTLEGRKAAKIAVDEAIVRMCLDPLYVPDVSQKEQRWAAAAALLRTGSIFVLDPDEVAGAFASAGDAPAVPEFPPLPFPRVVIESNEAGVPLFTQIHEYEGEPDPAFRTEVFTLGIVEQEQGRVWDVMLAAGFRGLKTIWQRASERVDDPALQAKYEEWSELSEDEAHQIEYARVTPEAVIGGEDWQRVARNVGIPESELAKYPSLDSFGHLIGEAVTAAHLIVAERVRHEPIPLPRPQRRDYQRRYRLDHPQVYFVDLAAAGEERRPGVSERTYRVRWLVRGHWRLSEAGSTYVAAKGGMCTWIKPYVKGPAGAPWKGRPVHVAGATKRPPERVSSPS